MKRRLRQIKNWACANLDRVFFGKRFWQQSIPVAGQWLAYALDNLGNWKTASWGGNHDRIPNFGTSALIGATIFPPTHPAPWRPVENPALASARRPYIIRPAEHGPARMPG